MSASTSLCNLELTSEDLAKLCELDPLQSEGFQTHARLTIPVHMIYTDELGHETQDLQMLGVQILTRIVKASPKDKEPTMVDQIKVSITSETDLYLNLICLCNRLTFESMRNKNSLNLDFNAMPQSLEHLLKQCGSSVTTRATLHLGYDGIAKFMIDQQTQYKLLQLMDLTFSNSPLEKVQQSIIYRYNYQRTKLGMIEKAIQDIYMILQSKNPPLLDLIKRSVGLQNAQQS